MNRRTLPAIDRAVGNLVVTSLYDGVLRHNATDILRGIRRDAIPGLLNAAKLGPELVQDVNAFLVRDGRSSILIDAGCGTGMGPDNGLLADSLSRAGVQPEDIDLVLLTHMHPDHIGGLILADGTARYASARVLAPARDADHFLDAQVAASAPNSLKPVYGLAQTVAAAYRERFGTLEGGDVACGIAPVPLHGHSPGHTGFRLTSGSETLLVWGDLLHLPELQFSYLGIGTNFDFDAAATDRSKLETLEKVSASSEVIAGAHMPHPGFARISKSGQAYRFEALSDGDVPASRPSM